MSTLWVGVRHFNRHKEGRNPDQEKPNPEKEGGKPEREGPTPKHTPRRKGQTITKIKKKQIR